jgi:hemolysin III
VPADRLPPSAAPRVLPLPAAAVPEVRVRPRLRGLSHQDAFFASLASGTLLVLLAATPRATLATAIYAASVSALFGVSALSHRSTWTTPARRRMRWLGGTVYLALGWVAVVATPQLFTRLGLAGGLLLVAGGLVYSAGVAVYALRRPDPVPAVFGYHEVFHLLVIAGVAAHFLAISRYALPTG